MYIVPKIEVREAEDIADFATTMDSDMNQYFEEKKTLLEDIPRGENPGTAYYSFYPAVINPKLFYAYILAIKYDTECDPISFCKFVMENLEEKVRDNEGLPIPMIVIYTNLDDLVKITVIENYIKEMENEKLVGNVVFMTR